MGRENAETKENKERKGREYQTGEVKNKNWSKREGAVKARKIKK
jgi:hypothetical protein